MSSKGIVSQIQPGMSRAARRVPRLTQIHKADSCRTPSEPGLARLSCCLQQAVTGPPLVLMGGAACSFPRRR